MFGIGISEVVVILLIILVLINPKDLPKIARKLGQWARKFQEARGKFDEEVDSIEKEIRKPFNDTKQKIDSEVKSTADFVTIKQPLPDLKSIMPSGTGSFRTASKDNGNKKPDNIEDKDEKTEEEIETKV